MREMDTEQHFQYFRMSKYFLMTSYIGLHPISNTKIPTVSSKPPEFHRDQLWRYGSSGSSQQCVAPVDPHSHPFCEPSFFSPQQVDHSFISVATTECSVQPTNQNVRQIKTTSATLQVLTGERHCPTTCSYVFFTSFLSEDAVDTCLTSVKQP